MKEDRNAGCVRWDSALCIRSVPFLVLLRLRLQRGDGDQALSRAD